MRLSPLSLYLIKWPKKNEIKIRGEEAISLSSLCHSYLIILQLIVSTVRLKFVNIAVVQALFSYVGAKSALWIAFCPSVRRFVTM